MSRWISEFKVGKRYKFVDASAHCDQVKSLEGATCTCVRGNNLVFDDPGDQQVNLTSCRGDHTWGWGFGTEGFVEIKE